MLFCSHGFVPEAVKIAAVTLLPIKTLLATSYAHLSMGKYDLDFITIILLDVKYWGRYIKDCFLIWKDSEEELHEFIQFLNPRLDSITFSFEYNLSSIHFLDVLISKILFENQQTIIHYFLHYITIHY